MNTKCLLLLAVLACVLVTSNARRLQVPIVINTWNFTSANVRAWQELSADRSAIDAIEKGCGQCEMDRCDGSVGWGGSPAENGETTLDAMIFDGETYNVGGVGGLRRIREAISVARMVLERTNHTLLVGDMATQFAVQLGFQERSLSSRESRAEHRRWVQNSCQPNYWMNVSPDPRQSCGPYHLPNDEDEAIERNEAIEPLEVGHDTIGMVARDSRGFVAAGTSTNGLRYKILGRVGDSPMPGAGAYAGRDAGAAACTGDGDVMMRHLLSYTIVENMRRGMGALEAAQDAIARQAERTGRPYANAAVIALGNDGTFGAACSGYRTFPFLVSDAVEQHKLHVIDCLTD